MNRRWIEFSIGRLSGSYLCAILLTIALIVSISCTDPDAECREFYSKHQTELKKFVEEQGFETLMQKDTLIAEDYPEMGKMGIKFLMIRESFLSFHIGMTGGFTIYDIACVAPDAQENPAELFEQQAGGVLISWGKLEENWYYYVTFYD